MCDFIAAFLNYGLFVVAWCKAELVTIDIAAVDRDANSSLTRATGDRRKTIISISKVSDLHERRLGEEDFQTETPVKNKKMLDIQRRYEMANEI